jgi:hypothetical protein
VLNAHDGQIREQSSPPQVHTPSSFTAIYLADSELIFGWSHELPTRRQVHPAMALHPADTARLRPSVWQERFFNKIHDENLLPKALRKNVFPVVFYLRFVPLAAKTKAGDPRGGRGKAAKKKGPIFLFDICFVVFLNSPYEKRPKTHLEKNRGGGVGWWVGGFGI